MCAEDLYRYLTKYGIDLDIQLEALIGTHSKKPVGVPGGSKVEGWRCSSVDVWAQGCGLEVDLCEGLGAGSALSGVCCRNYARLIGNHSKKPVVVPVVWKVEG